jgi:WD40 repeat protein/mono/diheme cytochrome c family protein
MSSHLSRRRFARTAALLALLLGAASQLTAREWVDASGKFKVEAELVAIRNGKAILERPDGSLLTIPVEKLSAADQTYLKQQAAPPPTATTLAATAPAASPAPITAEGSALAQKAQGVLRANCYRCHGEDGASEGGFNFVLNLEKLAKTVVKPRNASGSLLWERISASGDSAMPPVGETPRPSAEDLAVIKAWIDAGAPAPQAEKPRDFITNEQIWKHIRADIEATDQRSRKYLRYFSLTHLWNAGVSEDEIQTYRNAFVKLLNSLSWNTELVIPKPVDPARTILRIDFRQVHWNAEIWEQIEQANPYSLVFTFNDARTSYALTQCEMPLVRVDWFVFAASKPPLYHAVLAVPTSDADLESSLKVNVEANIDQEQAIRAAFNRSGVSQNNRLIEWHKSPYGSYWKSYDFGGNTDRQNLFAFPLGPHGNDAFRHDGGEIIFTLPNGLQGYLLVDGSGKRIDAGPTNIVSDPKRGDKTVTNGVSCMSCHYTGVIAKTDEVGPVVRANPKAFENSADILALYRDPKELNAILAADAQRFAVALEKLGIASLSRSGEPVSAMALRFEQELDLRLAACELGLSVEEFLKRLDGAETTARILAPLRTARGTVKRDVFASTFGEAAVELKVVLEAGASIGLAASVTPRATSNVPPAPAVASSGRSSRPSRSSRSSDSPPAPQVEFGGNKPGEVRRFGDLGWGVESLAFSPGGTFLAAGKMDSALMLFDVPGGGRSEFLDKLELLGQVKAVVFTPNGSRLLAGGYSGQITIYDVSREGNLKEVGQFVGHSKEINCIAVSNDSRFALSGSAEKKVRYWEIESGRELAVFANFQGRIKTVQIAKNGRTALATDGEMLIFIDLTRKEVSRTRKLTSTWAAGNAAAISPDGSLAAVGDSSAIRLFNLESVGEYPPMEDSESQASMAFTPDGTRLVSGARGKLNVWDMKTKRKIASLATGTIFDVQALATSPDNKHAAGIGSAAGQELQVFRLPNAER